MADRGVGLTVTEPEQIGEARSQVLEQAKFRETAADVRDEIAWQPSPAEVVGRPGETGVAVARPAGRWFAGPGQVRRGNREPGANPDCPAAVSAGTTRRQKHWTASLGSDGQ